MKPSEKIAQIYEQRIKAQTPIETVHSMILAIVDYLDEVHRYEHPDWEAECARIVKERPDILALKAWQGTIDVGCPEEGEPFTAEPRLFIRIIVRDDKMYLAYHARQIILDQVEDDLRQFSDTDRADSEMRTETEHRASAEVDRHNRTTNEWPAIPEAVTA